MVGSVIEKRVARNAKGDLVLTVKVTGASDIYRFADGMTRLQSEFCQKGRLALRSLYKALGRERFLQLDSYMYGDGRGSGGKWRRRP